MAGAESVSKQITDAIGKPSTTDPVAAATGLWLDIETALNTAVSKLQAQVDAINANTDAVSLNSITELKAAIVALQALAGAESVSKQITDAIGKPSTTDPVAAATGLWLDIETALNTAISDLQAQVDAINANADAVTLNSIAELKAAIVALQALSGAESVSKQISDAIGKPSTTVPVAAATGLWLDIETALNTAVSDLQAQVDAINANADAVTLNSIAELKAAIVALQALSGAESVSQQITDAIGKPSTTDPVAAATGLWLDIETALNTAVSDLQAQVDAINANADAVTLNSIAELKAAIVALQALSGAESVSQQITDAIGKPSTTDPVAAATGLWLDIETALNKAVSNLNQDITDLQTAVDSNAANTALIKDDTNAVGNSSGSPTTNSIAGLKAALLALQSSSGSASGDLTSLASRVLALENSLDETAPKITDIAITASNPDANGAYGEGDVVRVTVTFDEAVLVNGAPTFALDVGAPPAVQAALVGGAGTNKLVFEYTLTGAQTDANGIGAAANALKLNSGAITDAAGNAAVITSALVAESLNLVVDNTPLTVTMSAGAVFGSQFNADKVLVGYVDSMEQQVFLSDLDTNGQYQVPAGASSGFVDMDAFIRVMALKQDPSLLQSGLTPPGGTFQLDFSDKLAFFFEPGFAVILTEANLRSILNFEQDPSYTPEQINEFIAEQSVAAESVWLYDGANAGETLSDELLAAVQGHNPADVVLDITSSLTVAQAAKLIDAGFNLVDNATYTVRDWDTTIQAGMLNADTRAALQGATQVVARGDELANAMRFTSFDQSVKLRVEAAAGNDSIDAGRGNETIVGQAGADTINLTSHDTSRDTVVYQSINDGASLPVSTVTFSTDPDDYRVGSVLTVTINGVEYTHTVATQYGATITAATIEAELAAFAREIAAQTVNSPAVVAYRVSIADIINGNGDNAVALTVADLDANGRYLVPAGYRVIPADTLFLLDTELVDLLADPSPQYLLGIIGVGAGGDYHADSSLQLFDLSLLPGFQAGPTGGSLFMVTPEAMQAAYGAELANVVPSMTIADLRVVDVLSAVSSNGSSLSFIGKSGATLTAIAGGDVEAAIDNNGQVTVVTVDFSGTVADWPTATNTGHTTKFDRELSITIDGKEITAKVVFDPVSGAPDPAKSVLALKTAIETANAQNGSIAGKLASVTISNTDPTMLTLTGKVPPITDAAAPTFKVDSATVDTNGVQQVSKVTYSSDDADYYEGGTLSVKIAGQTVTADMVAGDAVASVQNLRDAVDAAANGLTTAAFEFTIDLEASTTFINSNSGPAQYMIDMKIGNVSVVKTVSVKGDVSSFKSVDGLTVASDETKATNVGELVDELNRAFEGLATFKLDAALNKITFATTGSNELTSASGAYSGPLLSITNSDGLNSFTDKPTTTTTQVNPAIAAVLEGVVFNSQVSIPELIFSAQTEAADPLKVDLSMTYQGEQQQATLTLETGGEDGIYDVPADSTTDRLADVHYVGGKAYVTITGAGTDGILGNADDDTVVVSADMGATAAQTNQKLVDAINVKITGTEPTPPVITIAANLLADAYIWADAGGAGSGTLKITLGFGSLDVPDVVVNLVQVQGGWAPEGAPYSLATMQQLLELGFADGVNGFLGAFPYIGSAVVNADGDIVITSKELVPTEWDGLPEGGVLPYLSFSFEINGNVAVELQTFSGNASSSVAPDQVLSQLLESATLDEFGTITLTAKDYAKETFEITDVTLDYQGVQQIATLSLDTDTAYTSTFTDAQTVDNGSFSRGANVYYEGGKAYVSITGAGADGILGNADDDTVVVSADMGDTAAETNQNLVDAINGKINGSTAPGTPPVITIPGDYKLTDSLIPSNSGATLTLYLADERNNFDSLNFTQSGGKWVFAGPGPEFSFSTLGELLTAVESIPYIDTATVNADGDIVITGISTDLGANQKMGFGVLILDGTDLPEQYQQFTSNGSVLSDANGLVSGVDGPPILPDAVLSQLLSSATLGEDGTITLTAKDYAKETFAISDVTLDYQGVKQQATITLEKAATFDSTFTDSGTPTPGVYGRGADVYYEGGKIHATILNMATNESVTVSADMVTAQPASITIDLANTILGTSVMNGTVINLYIPPSFTPPATINVGGAGGQGITVNDFMAQVAAFDFIESAALVDGNLVITAKDTVDELSVAAFLSNMTIDSVVAVPIGSANPAFSSKARTDVAALNSQALADAINEAINGSTGTPVTLSFAKDIGVFTLEEELLLGNHFGSPSIKMTYIINGGAPYEVFLDGDTSDDGGLNVRGTNMQLATIGDLLSYIETLSGIGSATIKDGVIQITSEDTGADTTLGITFLDVEDRGWVNYTGISWRSGLLDPQIVNGTGGPSVSIDPVLSQLLQDAAVVDGNIVLTAKNAGEETFNVTDVALDYQGQYQQATSTFSTTDGDYYADGTLSMTIDTTPDVPGDSANDVKVTVDMVDGDAAASQQALVDAINLRIIGVPSSPAVVTVGQNVSRDDVVYSAGSGGFFMYFFYDGDGAGAGEAVISTAVVSFEVGLGAQFILRADSASEYLVENVDANSYTLGNFVDWLNGVTSEPNVPLLSVEFSVVNNQLQMSLRDTSNTVAVTGLAILGDLLGNVGPAFDEINGFYVDYGVTGVPGDLASVLSDAALNPDGTITLTSATKTEHSFNISTATVSDLGKAEVTEVLFSTNDNDYFTAAADAAGNPGKLSLTVNGVTYTVNMQATAEGTLSALESAMTNGQPSALIPVAAIATVGASFTRNKGTFTITGAAVGDALDVSATLTKDAVPQVTDISFKQGFDDTDFIAGIGRKVSITVAGVTFELDGDTRLELLQDLETQLLAAITADTGGIASKLAPGGVDLNEANLKLTLTAKYGGLNPFDVSDFTRAGFDETNAANKKQELQLFLTNGYMNELVGTGETVTFDFGKTRVSYTVPQGANGEAVLNGIVSALNSGGLIESALLVPAIDGVDGRFITIKASFWGPNVLGTASNGLDNTVRVLEGVEPNVTTITTGYAVSQKVAGAIEFQVGNDETVATANDTAGADIDHTAKATTTTTTVAAAAGDVAAGTITNAGDNNPDLLGDSALTGANGVQQDFVNPGVGADTVDGTNSNLYGDSALTGANGMKQNVVNPGVGADTVNGSNATFYGDKALTGSSGVTQSYTNPGNGYDATGGAPVQNTNSANNGDGTLYGSNPGTYTDTTLDTTYLNGGTANGNGGYDYGAAGNPADNLSVGDGAVSGDGGTSGKASGTVTDTTSGSDGLAVTQDKAGFAPFEWDLSLLTVRSTGSSVADVVNNFQTAYDLVALESALLASTVEGDVTGVQGYATQRLVTKTFIDGVIEKTQDLSYTTEVSYAWDLPSVDTPFSITMVQNQYNSTALGLREIEGSSQFTYPFATGTQSFDNLADFVATMNATSTDSNAPDFTARLGDDGRVLLSAPAGYYISGAAIFVPEVTFTVNEEVAFDLSTTEFGLVDSAESTLNAAELSSSTDVAALLNSVFDFNAAFGGTTDNSEINTTVFGVTAADNPNVTAIWAHTQSSTGDNTVESQELNLLATVNTLGQEFQLDNFLPKPASAVIPG